MAYRAVQGKCKRAAPDQRRRGPNYGECLLRFIASGPFEHPRDSAPLVALMSFVALPGEQAVRDSVSRSANLSLFKSADVR
jgi:hypothetical protein